MSPPHGPGSGRAALGLSAGLLALGALSCDQLASGLRVHVTLDAALRSTCVRLRVHTSQDTSAPAAEELSLVRPAGDHELVVAVYREDLPRDVWVAAQPLYGTACEAATLDPNGDPAVLPASFPGAGLSTLEVALAPPPRSLDADGDGFAGNGGPDCLDGNQDAHPEAAERCQEPVDHDCDGLVGCADPGCPAAACLEVPEALAFVGTPQALVAGQCAGPVVVETRTVAGAPRAVTVDTPIAFASPDATLTVHATAACGAAVTQATVPAGTARAQVYVRGTQAGQGTLQATAPGLAPISQTHPIQAAAPASLVFVTAPQSLALGLCSGAVTVQLRDAFGNPAPATAARAILLSSTSPSTTRFHADAACATGSVNSLDIPAGEHSLTFYFRSTASSPGPVTLTADAGPGTLTVNQTQTLVQRTPTRIAFTNSPVSVPEGQCSGALTVQAQDGTGAAAPVAADTTVSLSASPGTLTFYPDAACSLAPASTVTIPGGGAQAQLSFVGSSPGSPAITASTSSLGLATQTETVTPVAPTRLVFTSAEKMITTDDCSGAVVVETRDASAVRPVLANTTVTFADDAPAGSFTLHAGSGCAGQAITSAQIAAGSSSVTVSFRALRPASVSLTASAPPLAPATQVETISAGAPAGLAFTSAAQTVDESSCSAPVALELRDAAGNATGAPAGGLTINLTSTFGNTLTFHGQNTCTAGNAIASVAMAAGASAASFHFRSTQVGMPTLTASPAGGSILPATQVQTIAAAAPTELVFQTMPFTVAADQCAGPLTVETRDAMGVRPALMDTTVNLTSTAPAGTFTFYAGNNCGGNPVTSVLVLGGTSTADLSFRGTRSGQPDVTVSAAGLTSATQRQIILPGPPTALVFLGSAQTLPIDTCSAQVAVEVHDAFGNPTPATGPTQVSFTSSLPSGFTFHANAADCGAGTAITSVTIPTGTTTATFFYRSSQTGTGTITGSGGGLTPASQGVTITGGPPASLTFANGPVTATAGVCSPLITLEARDSLGNLSPVATNVTVNLSSTLANASFYPQAGCGGNAGPTVTLAAGTSSVDFSFRINTAGAGAVDSASSIGNDSLPVTVDASTPTSMVFAGAPITLPAGACSGTVRPLAIQLWDAFSNAAKQTGGPLTVTLTQAVGSGLSFFDDSACTNAIAGVTIADGSTTSGDFFFSTTAAGAWDITASGGSYPNVSQTETVNAGPPAQLAFISQTRNVAVNACSGSPPVQVQIQDAYGNRIAPSTATTVTFSPASWQFFDKSMCQGSGLLAGDQLIIPASTDTGSVYFTSPGPAATYTMTADAAGLTQGAQSWNITP